MQKPRSSLGQDPSCFHLCLQQTFRHSSITQILLGKSRSLRSANTSESTSIHTQVLQGENWSPKVLIHLIAQIRPPILLKFMAQEGNAQSHQDTETKEWPWTRTFQFPSAHRSWPCATALHTQILPRERWSPRSIDTKSYRRGKPQSEIAKPNNTRDSQMVRSNFENISNRNQGYSASSESSSPTKANPGYSNTL